MGMAFYELKWSPDMFWQSTLRELMTAYAYAYAIPTTEVNTPKFEPFTAFELEVFKEIRERDARDERLARGY